MGSTREYQGSHGPTRASGQALLKLSWVGLGRSGRVGSGGFRILTDQVRSPLPDPTLIREV